MKGLLRRLSTWEAACAALCLALVGFSCRGALLCAARGGLDAGSLAVIVRWDVPALALAALLVLACWGLGLRLRDDLDAPAAFGLGLGLLGSAVLALGVFGWLRRPALAALLAAAGAAGLPALWAHRFAGAAKKPSAARSAWAPPAGAVLGFAGLSALAVALAPATAWDALAYHLAEPKLLLRAGRVLEIPWMVHSHWPSLMETLYALPLSFGLDCAAALLHAAACAAWLLAVFSAARRRLGEGCAWLAVALLGAQPQLLELAGTAHSDGALALFHFLACVSLWDWKEDGRERDLALGGIFSGLAASCKLLGAIPLAALSAWTLWQAPRGGKTRAWLLYTGAALAVVAPWYLKSWVLAGDPVWPFLPSLFAARFGARWVAAATRAADAASVPAWRLLVGGGALWLAVPAAALSAAALMARRRWPGFLAFLWLPVPLYVLLVGAHAELWRLLWPFWPAFALTAAYWAGQFGAAAAPAAAFGLCGLAAVSPNNALFGALGLRPASGAADRRARYLDAALDDYAFEEKVNALLAGRPAKVLLFREIRGYYLDVPYEWGDPVNQGLIRYDRLPDAAALRERLAGLGVTHVLVDEGLAMYAPGATYYSARTVSLMDACLRLYAVPAMREGALALFALKQSPVPQIAADARSPGNIGSRPSGGEPLRKPAASHPVDSSHPARPDASAAFGAGRKRGK